MLDTCGSLTEGEKKKEDWMNNKWRPAMGWMYMVVCVFDFILAPILWAVVQFWETSAVNDAFRQWQPLTLQGAGLFHMAMGAVLGLTAWGRTQEKLQGANNGGIAATASLPISSSPSILPVAAALTPAATTVAVSSFTPSTSAPVTTNANGKKVVPQDPEPEI